MDVWQTGVVERIARVLAGQRLSINADGASASAGPSVDTAWRGYADDAIAVLKTLRAPDADMAAVGDVAVWERMIAAALGTPLDTPVAPDMSLAGNRSAMGNDDAGIDVSTETGAPDADRPLASNVGGTPRVRSAGPEAIPGLPGHVADDWDEVDQNVDESFPASDPPGQGVG